MEVEIENEKEIAIQIEQSSFGPVSKKLTSVLCVRRMAQKHDRSRSRAPQNIPLEEPSNTREHGNLSFNTVVDETAKEVGRVHITDDGKRMLEEIAVEVRAVQDIMDNAVRKQSEPSKEVLGSKVDGKKKKK